MRQVGQKRAEPDGIEYGGDGVIVGGWCAQSHVVGQ